KQMMHADVVPERRLDRTCLHCGYCVDSCPESAVFLEEDGPVFDLEKCVGCGECITACPEGVIKILWNSKPENFAQKLAEGGKAAIFGKENSSVFINGLLSVTPECDCVSDAGAPMMEDLGWFMSTDPVAVDRACFDAVLQNAGHDIFKDVHPNTFFEKTLDYAEEIGLGKNSYELEEVK
ncbi:4Fe-4S binding protein, partial [candidate division WOR-3 bacterium]|nr:4Fe-4S binding protein [candidate division WOR-3 bacterium]